MAGFLGGIKRASALIGLWVIALQGACSDGAGSKPGAGLAGSSGTTTGGAGSGGTGTGGASSGGARTGGTSTGSTGSGGRAVDMTVVSPSTPVARTEATLRGRLILVRNSGYWTIQSTFDSAAGFMEYGFVCHLSVLEGCEIENCGFPAGAVTGTLYHPGQLTLLNQTTGQMTVIDPKPLPGDTTEGVYPELFDRTLMLNVGDTVKLTAKGTADVPAFEATLVVPTPLANASATALPASVPKHSFRGENGLGFSWAPVDGLVLVRFSSGPYGFNGFDPSFHATAYCAYMGAQGMAGLSSQVISTTECSNNAGVTLSAYSEAQIVAGKYAVAIQIQDESNIAGWVNCVK